MGLNQLRKSVPVEEFDYQLLMDNLGEYANKRDAITRLIRSEKIIRVKKGLYIFGPDYRKGLVCKEALANQIYGPSYISYEYALSFYGMIPERVEVLTSSTTGKSRKFHTPIGSFSYRYQSLEKYQPGITLKQLDDYHSILIATPEKAILDQVYISRGLSEKTDMKSFFEDDLRVETHSLKTLSLPHLTEIAEHFSSARVTRAIKYIKELQNHA